MTTRDLIDDFIAHIADMPDAVLKDKHATYRKWTMHYDPVRSVLALTCFGFGGNREFTYAKKREYFEFIFEADNFMVDDMSGEDWFLSWRDGLGLEITGLEELL